MTVRDWAALDAQRLGLWAPVALALGIGIYFGMKSEPDMAPYAAALVGAAVAAHYIRNKRLVFQTIALVLLGFVAANLRTEIVKTPVLQSDLGIRQISGRLITIENRRDAQRYVIELSEVEGLALAQTPRRVRLTWRGDKNVIAPGALVETRAGLGPPSPPAMPGGFDFARRLYFERIGAVGFAVAPLTAQAADDGDVNLLQRAAVKIERLRQRLFERIVAAAPGEGGAILAAIVTGKREAITEASEAALRDAGLAHLLAISGLHMGLATGIVFFCARFALAMLPQLALRFPIKKWAAAAALLAGFSYLILSGGGWSARRAFIMTAIMLTAIIVDRTALSLRNVAIAAMVILLTTPEALFHPGFQMSFAAVTALIAAYEWHAARPRAEYDPGFGARLYRYGAGVAATDTIAAMATAPFALYHFNRVAIYSLPANIVAMPVMGFWIMPAVVIAFVLLPFGIDGWAWRISAQGLAFVVHMATEVSGWRGAVSTTPQWPFGALLALTLGGLMLCLLRAPWRTLGVLSIPIAAGLVAAAPTPVVFVANSGRNAAIVGEHNLTAFTTRRDRFSLMMWMEAVGLDPELASVKRLSDDRGCDAEGCVARFSKSRTASFVSAPGSLAEDCARADLVVAFFPVSGADWRACDAALIDRRSVWRRGAHAVYVDKAGDIVIKTDADERGRRPWTGQD